MELRSLLKEHSETLAKVKTLNAIQEKRDLTEAENKELETVYTKGQDLKSQIEKRQKYKAIELAGTQPKDSPWKNEKRKASFKNCLAILTGMKGTDTGFEKEVDQELRKTTPYQSGGVLIPSADMWEVRRDKTTMNPQLEKRFVSASGNISTTDILGSEYVNALYEKSLFEVLGVKKINHMGPYKFPRSGGVSSGWISGDGGSDSGDSLTESDPTYTSISQEPHYLGVYSGWNLATIKSLVMGSPDLEMILREDLANSMQSQMFNAFLNGTNADNQPQGIVPAIPAANNTAVAVSSTALWSNAGLLDILKDLKTNLKNQAMGRTIHWLFNFTEEAAMKNTIKLASQTDSTTLWDESSNMICGHPAVASGHLGATSALVGDFSETILSEFGSVSLELGMIDKDFIKGTQRLRAIGCFDYAVRRTAALQKMTVTRT